MKNNYKEKIREVKDFPIPSVSFKDITPLLADTGSFSALIDDLAVFFKDIKVDKVLGIDARGFLLAAPVAYVLNKGIVIVRKKGKLPYQTIVTEHDLEYGRGTMEIHIDAVQKGEKILIIDDVLATGGTAKAAVDLVEKLGGEVIGLGFLLELQEFNGRAKIKNYNIQSLITF